MNVHDNVYGQDNYNDARGEAAHLTRRAIVTRLAPTARSVNRLRRTAQRMDRQMAMGTWDAATDHDFDELLTALDVAEEAADDLSDDLIFGTCGEPGLSGWYSDWKARRKERKETRKKNRATRRTERKTARKARVTAYKAKKKEQKKARAEVRKKTKGHAQTKAILSLRKKQRKERQKLVKKSLKDTVKDIKTGFKTAKAEYKHDKMVMKEEKGKMKAGVDPELSTVSAEEAMEASSAEAEAQAEASGVVAPEEEIQATSFLWPTDKPIYKRPAAIGGVVLLGALAVVVLTGKKKPKAGEKSSSKTGEKSSSKTGEKSSSKKGKE